MSKKANATDPSRFQGNGISYRAKIIGIEDVPEARGDKMCQEMIQKLKGEVKSSKQHKQRVFINVTLEGLKIIDGASMTVLPDCVHPVHQISFISRDVTDSRAFGFIYGPGEGIHKFFAIKTANAAENLVLCLRDLFQTVYEMKKKEIEDTKAKSAETGETTTEGEEGKTADRQESIYQVPKNNAPVNPQQQEEQAANLLDLEDQVDNILKGIEQIKNLEFDELSTEEAPRQPVTPTSPTSPGAPSAAAPPAFPGPPTPHPAANDPWGMPAASPAPPAASQAPTSAISDLAGLVSSPPPAANPFGGMTAFPGAPGGMGMAAPGFGAMGQPGMAQPGLAQPGMAQPGMAQPGMQPGMFAMPGQQPGMPGSQNPFGADPFGQKPMMQQQAPGMMAAPFGQQPGFGGAPFVPPRVPPAGGNPFPGAMGVPGMQPGFGMAPPGAMGAFGAQGVPTINIGAAPFGQAAPDESLLQPQRPGGEDAGAAKMEAKPGLFDDLVDIKKSAGAGGLGDGGKSPKEMFKELQQPPKKSLNEIKAGGGVSPQPKPNMSPFGDSFGAPGVNGKEPESQS